MSGSDSKQMKRDRNECGSSDQEDKGEQRERRCHEKEIEERMRNHEVIHRRNQSPMWVII